MEITEGGAPSGGDGPAGCLVVLAILAAMCLYLRWYTGAWPTVTLP